MFSFLIKRQAKNVFLRDVESTVYLLKHIGKNIKFNIIHHVQRQAGVTECGLFVIACTVALGFGLNPAKLLFKQEKMRDHLIAYLEEKKFSNFPYSINTNWRKKNVIILYKTY